jgi:hypothetical protein
MSDQIVLAWTVSVAGTPFGPLQARALLQAVALYQDDTTDPVLGQIFGLTVADDQTTNDATSATRTLTLNMNEQNSPTAPPPFPCRPRTSTLPVLPYPLRTTKTLPGSFFVSNGSSSVKTSATQLASLVPGDSIQFLIQEGVFYTVLAIVDATEITLTGPYAGTSGNSEAFKEVTAPCSLDHAAVYSSADDDTNGVATTPAIDPGPGARTVELTYLDSSGAGPFTAQADLTGRRPALFDFGEAHGTDIAVIVNLAIVSVGGFANSLGEITLCELSGDLPAIPVNATPGTGIGAGQGDRTFFVLTDEAQLLIERHLAYLPPSYFALAQQGAATPALEGDFLVTTGSKDVPTTEDQTGVVSGGDLIEFADQMGTLYTVDQVTPKIIRLTTAYSGIDTNNTGLMNTPNNNSVHTKGNLGDEVINKRTGARDVSLSGAPPTNTELAGPLAQFVALETASPPPNPPGAPATVPVPTFLSGLFTRTLQLAMKGVPVTPATISFV